MEQEKLNQLTKQVEKLCALEALVLHEEKEWYRLQLREILTHLENFNQEMRRAYGMSIADILALSSLPDSFSELARLIAHVKQRLREYTAQNSIDTTKLTYARYRFFSAV